MEWVMSGRAWKFGHDIPVDGAVMPLEYVRARMNDPAELAKHVMEGRGPGFSARVKAGDIIVAGRRFAHGNPHIHGFIGIRALGMGLVCESMPWRARRMCVVAAVPAIVRCPGLSEFVEQGDELRVDFRTGEVEKLRSGQVLRGDPLPPALREVIEAGGSTAYIPRLVKLIESGAV